MHQELRQLQMRLQIACVHILRLRNSRFQISYLRWIVANLQLIAQGLQTCLGLHHGALGDAPVAFLGH
ncbi:hypothetical protein [Xanthomonas fragariae]|nr:hypothetical protein [Xanthomonas fragariae]